MTNALSPEQILAAARAQAGLDDEPDADVLQGLERNLEAFADMPLTAAGRADAAGSLAADLAGRLRLDAWLSAHPEVAAEKVEGPLLVCGLPRTGTTATVAMLALDPRFRFLRGWEGRSPVPPPVAGHEADDPRRIAAHAAASALDASLHLSDPDGPEEDLAMIAGLNMRSMHGRFPMPDSYMDWWVGDDFASTYACHARILKTLQSRRPPNHWLLKAPPHLYKLEAFARQYPDARFVMTHRDPAKVIGSVASLYHTLYARLCEPGAVEKRWTGRRCLEFWSEGVRRGLEARARIGEHRFVDVYNRDLVKDPVATFEALYEQLGFEIDAALRGRLRAYHDRNAAGRFGAHAYTLEEYGVSEGDIRAGFGEYMERFEL